MQWTDIFTEVSRRKVGNCGDKTLLADQITWRGLFRGHAVCLVSTVRLVLGNLRTSTLTRRRESERTFGSYPVDITLIW